MDLKNIDKKNATFWSLGNYPTQKVNNLTFAQVYYNLKLLYLLSDKILAAGSFYFESEITRKVTERFQKLFENEEIIFFIDEDIEDFKEHGEKKVKKSPKSFEAYRDKNIVKERGEKMDCLFIPLRRPPLSISNKIVELWINEIQSNEIGTLGQIIDKTINENDKRGEVKLKLINFANERKKDFVWEYLLPQLTKLKLSKEFKFLVRRKLSQLYSVATAEILDVLLDNNDLPFYNKLSYHTKYDTFLFDECMKTLDLREALYNLSTPELIFLKSSQSFVIFREFYFSLIESTSYKTNLSRRIIPILVEVEKKISENIELNIDEFLNSFNKYCKEINIPKKSYQKPLEIILSKYEAFSTATITPFIELVNENIKRRKFIEKSSPFHLPLFIKAKDFVKANKDIIYNVIINNWKIAETDVPGKFEDKYKETIAWFENFNKTEFELALMVYQNIDLFTEDRIDELLHFMSGELINLFNNNFSNVNIFGLGNFASDSGGKFLYQLMQKLKLTGKYFPKDFNNLSKNIKSIVFIDDIIGTGKQAKEFCDKYLSNINIDKYYYSLLGFKKGKEYLEKNSKFKAVYSAKTLDECNKAFSDNSEIFMDMVTRKKIEKMALKYGELLYPKGPLGYDESQALIAFAHNTPNNTLPIIWASMNNEKTIGVSWNPIWDRIKVIERKT